MTKDEAKKILEKNLEAMRKQKKLNKQAESKISEGDESSLISGPKNELDYQRMKRDIKESNDEK